MGIKTVPQPPYNPDVAPCDFCLFPKLRGCRYETIEEMKEAETKVIDTLTQEDFHGALQKLLELYKCIAAGGDYFEGDESFMWVLSIKVHIRKTSENLSYAPCIIIMEELLFTKEVEKDGMLPFLDVIVEKGLSSFAYIVRQLLQTYTLVGILSSQCRGRLTLSNAHLIGH